MSRVIGVPKEIKDQESRISLQPDGVAELVHHGHEVVVQAGAGGAGFSDEDYEQAGSRIAGSADEAFDKADLTMSEVAGGMSLQAAAHSLESPQGGSGRCCHRPGWLHGDLKAYHPLRPNVCRGRGSSLLYLFHVANIPGAVARTSTLALTNATLPYMVQIAQRGIKEAAQESLALAKGLSTLDGERTSEPVSEAHDLPYASVEQVLKVD